MLVTRAPTSTRASAPSPNPATGPSAQQRDRVQVDAVGPQPSQAHRLEVAGEHLLLGRDQQHPQQALAAGGLVLTDHRVVELGLVDRDGQVVAGLEGQRAAQLVGLHPGHVDQPHDHPLVGHPDDHPPAADPCPSPQVLDRDRDGAGFDDLTVSDHALGQAGLPDPLDPNLAAADRHLGRAYRGGADVESDALSGHVVRLPCCAWVRRLAPRDEASAVKVIDSPKCDLEQLAVAGS
jgi:hypothetical protein